MKILDFFKGYRNIAFRILACIYSAVLFYLNYIRVFDVNLWGDEAYTAWIIKYPVNQLIDYTAADVHPPLYYIGLKAFCGILGQRATVFHFFSVLALACMLIFALTVIWKEFGPAASLIVITFTSISDAALRFNVEIRMYSWAAVFVFLTYYFTYCLIKRPAIKYYVGFSIASLAAAYTHYYALVAVAFFYAYLLIRAIVYKRTELIKTLIVSGIAIAVYLPWLTKLISCFTARIDNYWIAEYSSFSECFSYLFSDHFTFGMWFVIILMLVLTVLYETGFATVEKSEAREYKVKYGNKIHYSETVEVIIAGLLSIAGTMATGIWISALVSPFFVTRYIYVVAPVAWLILGILFSKMKMRILWTPVFLAFTLSMLIPAYKEIYYGDVDIMNRTQFVLDVLAYVDGDDMIITNFGGDELPMYYFDGKQYVNDADINNMELVDNEGVTNWIIVGDNWSNEEIVNKVSEQGFGCDLILSEGMIGTARVCIYRCYKL
ncbi:glycosyltransferase family 39 protein [Butyrivibrio fibrisolvens]|uniref:glycosyltransferase family 39 protein n=1 Tax=Pseudobutyrivibrio ruminis TaxID=46206 RepID=UPI00041E63E0|nr:glycosyltransferase family 39 protein [Pseudobutyrivibrio ruminis]MDC7278868.1 glycosyltransferase family 39 protein [Butyrivibrio fibrisolvens]